MPASIAIRPAILADLPAINPIIEQAVMGWKLPERVKRLALPSYLYQAHDFGHMTLVVAECNAICGVAAWEDADPRDTPVGAKGLLLHGLYVDPNSQHRGIGRQLLGAAAQAATEGGYASLLVKAQAGAEGFFTACGLDRLPVEETGRDYALRFWQPTLNK